MTADYAHDFVRVTISGTCFSGAEEWSTGFQMGSPTVGMSGVSAPAAESIAAAWETFFELASNSFSSGYKTTQVKCALIRTDGTTNVDEIDYYSYPSPISGGGSVFPLPPQITLAATLTTDNQRGLAAKGRMYLPGLNMPIANATGKLDSGAVLGLTSGFKTFLDSVNTGPGVSGKVVLASKGRKSDALDADGQPIYLGGRTAWVTGCRIGDVYDTQRRRRNGLNETYQTAVLAA